MRHYSNIKITFTVAFIGFLLMYKIFTLVPHASDSLNAWFFITIFASFGAFLYISYLFASKWYKTLFAIGFVMCIEEVCFNTIPLLSDCDFKKLCSGEMLTWGFICSGVSMLILGIMLTKNN